MGISSGISLDGLEKYMSCRFSREHLSSTSSTLVESARVYESRDPNWEEWAMRCEPSMEQTKRVDFGVQGSEKWGHSRWRDLAPA